ncbi:MAG: hypothetical protein LQ348_003566 [Seirophora lacunosa]|nr:MAG: hypothetical protein LQ348_003566 [Seirophora lacunosa]
MDGLQVHIDDTPMILADQNPSPWLDREPDLAAATVTSSEKPTSPLDFPPPHSARNPKAWLVATFATVAMVAIAAAIGVGVVLAKERNAGKHDCITPVTSTVNPPTSSCRTLPPIYSVPKYGGEAIPMPTNFSIRCGHNNLLPLVMAIRAYTFEDCIRACASQRTNVIRNGGDGNTGCEAANYKPATGRALTCWLKSRLNGPPNSGEEEKDGIDGALVLQD